MDDSTTPVHCERCCGILGTLCTILQHRRDLEQCMLVMPVYTKMMIERYQEQTTGSSDKDSVICYKGLVYKYHEICSFCAFMLSDGAMFLKSLRPVVTFEQRSDFPFGERREEMGFLLARLGPPKGVRWLDSFFLGFNIFIFWSRIARAYLGRLLVSIVPT